MLRKGDDPGEEAVRLKTVLTAHIKTLIRKTAKKITNIGNDIKKYSLYEVHLKTGELLKYSLAKIKKGASSFSMQDWENGSTVEIVLKPELTPLENMEEYFKKGRKMKKGLAVSLERLKESEEEISEFKELLSKIDAADDIEFLKELKKKYRLELPDVGKVKRIRKTLGKIYYYKEHFFLVGRNEHENGDLFKFAGGGNDWWFHARDYHGSSVFLIAPEETPDFELLRFGALLAMIHSKGFSASEIDVVYTRKKFLKKASGAPGRFIYTGEKTLKIARYTDVKGFRYEKGSAGNRS